MLFSDLVLLTIIMIGEKFEFICLKLLDIAIKSNMDVKKKNPRNQGINSMTFPWLQQKSANFPGFPGFPWLVRTLVWAWKLVPRTGQVQNSESSESTKSIFFFFMHFFSGTKHPREDNPNLYYWAEMTGLHTNI